MTAKIKRLIIDAALSALVTFVIAQAINVLKEDLDVMRKNSESNDEQ